MDLTKQITIFKEVIKNVSEELTCPLETFLAKLNREYSRAISEDNCDDVTKLFTTKFKADYPNLKKLGFNFLGMGDTRVAIGIDDYIFKMDHSRYPRSLKGNTREMTNWDFLEKYSPNMATIFVNPIIEKFPFNFSSVLIYKKCKMHGQKKFNKVFDRNPFMRDLGGLFEILSGDFHDMNVGYFGDNPIFVDIDSLSANCTQDMCETFNVVFNSLQVKYPKELQKYVYQKSKWLKMK